MYVPLMRADHRAFRRSRWYNPYGASLLVAASRILNDPTCFTAHFVKAYDLATNCLHLLVAAQQRMRAFWVRAQIHTKLGNNGAAIENVEEALYIAGNLEDTPALMELLALRGRLHFREQRLRKARDDFGASLYHLHYFGAWPTEPLQAFEATVNRQLATVLTYLADPHEAEWRLQFARQILPKTPAYRLESLAIDNMQAIAYRMQGCAECGLGYAFGAAEGYTDLGDLTSAARLHVGVADLALDRAETCGDPCRRFELTLLAAAHTEKAFELARELRDESAMLMATITRARGDRLSNQPLHRRVKLHHVVRRGQQMRDVPLQCQALKVLAEDYMATGQIVEALNCHRETLDILKGTDLPALGLWALRALN